MLAPASRTACTGSPEGRSPRRYRFSPAGFAGAAPTVHAHSSSETASNAGRAAPRLVDRIGHQPWRVILGGSKQVTVVVHQLIRCHKPLEAQPRLAGSRAHQ